MTAQVPEILELRGQHLALCEIPLRPYLSKLRKDRRPQFVWRSTACWRGYIGRWTIRDGMLFLTGLEGLIETAAGIVEASLADVLPRLRPPVAATWFSGQLRCAEGRLLAYVHAGFGTQYERDRFFRIERGKVLDEWVSLNPPMPLVYRIEPSGRRVCVEQMYEGAAELPDPLGDGEWDSVYQHWGRIPEGGSEDNQYLLGGWMTRPLPKTPELAGNSDPPQEI